MTIENEVAGAESFTKTNRKSEVSHWLAILLVVVAGTIAYSNSFSGAFVFDDHKILDNTHIRSLFPPWDALFARENVDRPLVGLSFAVNYAISESNVWSYHALNLMIHLLAALTLFGVIRRTLLSRRLHERWSKHANTLALCCALLWVVHPLTTQAVTYIIQRGESMMALFYLLTLYCAIRGIESSGGNGWYAAAVAACGAGMLSKQVMVTAPIAVLLWDYVFESEPILEAMRRRWPLYAGLASTWALLAATVIAAPTNPTAGFAVTSFTPLEYLKTEPAVILYYLRLSVWPDPLCLDYKWPKAQTLGEILPYAVLVVTLVAATSWGVVRRRSLSFAAAFFFLVLSVTSSVMPFDDPVFEHRMYLPLAGIVTFTVFVVFLSFRRLNKAISSGSQPARGEADYEQASLEAPRVLIYVGWAALVLAVAVLASLTISRNAAYRSDFAMMADIVRKRPENDRAHANLAFALASLGRHQEALQHLDVSCRLNPSNTATQYGLGLGLYLQGDASAAREHLEEAVRLKPDGAAPQWALGRVLLSQGAVDEAIEHLSKAVELNREFAPAYLTYGRALEKQSRYGEAIRQYRNALDLNWRWPEALSQLALTLATCEDRALHNMEEALSLAGKAVSLTGFEDPVALDVFAAVYAEAGRFSDASSTAQKAIDILSSRTALDDADKAQLQNLQERLLAYKKMDSPHPVTTIQWR
ncbi:MAG TPA: tetratricopeptide repeat protein [Blastocatellia bacterium]|nr:tetratricopeptide repeat protein [Blastocatellia bacterium]